MIKWLAGSLGISPLLVQLGLYGVALAALLYLGNCYVNKVGDERFDAGVKTGATRIDEAKKKEWALKEETLKKEQLQLDAAKAKAYADIETADKKRKQAEQERAQLLEKLRQKTEVSNATIIAIPASELDNSIREFLAEYIKSHPNFVPVVPIEFNRK